MSPHDAGDRGFTLVEILVSMILFGLVAMAVVPLMVGGLNASATSKLNTQAKALAQERLERIRNLPYHVARQNGQYVDVLDTYFRDIQPVGSIAANDTCSARSYDAATMEYTCVLRSLGADFTGFRQTVQAQFLDAARQVVTPLPGYDSQVSGQDRPASNLLGLEITTSWVRGGETKQFTVRSQVANASAQESLLDAELRLNALTLTSTVPSTADVLQLDAGGLEAVASLSTGSSASLNVTAARASTASGALANGASLNLVAPPSATGAAASVGGQTLTGDCSLVCFGSTSISGDQKVSVLGGVPLVSLGGDNQVRASLKRSGSNFYRGYTFNNVAAGGEDPALRLAGPMVSGGAGSATEVLHARGHVAGNGSGATALTAAGSLGLAEFQLFPTAAQPLGVVQIQLTSASLSCTSGGGAADVTSAWSGHVKYWSQSLNDYKTHELGPGKEALPDPATVFVDATTKLSTWIESWSALIDPASVVELETTRAQGRIPAVVSLITKPTRVGDVTSSVNVRVGALACAAEDHR